MEFIMDYITEEGDIVQVVIVDHGLGGFELTVNINGIEQEEPNIQAIIEMIKEGA